MKNKSEILIFGCIPDCWTLSVKPENVRTHFHNLTVTSAQNFLGRSCKHSRAAAFGLSLLLLRLHPHILPSLWGLPLPLCLHTHPVYPSSTIPGSQFPTTSHLPAALSSLPSPPSGFCIPFEIWKPQTQTSLWAPLCLDFSLRKPDT